METFDPESAQRKQLATIDIFFWAAKDTTSINQRIQNPDITWVPTKNRKNRSIYGYSRTSMDRRPSEAIVKYPFHQSPLLHILKAGLTHPQTLTSRNMVHRSYTRTSEIHRFELPYILRIRSKSVLRTLIHGEVSLCWYDCRHAHGTYCKFWRFVPFLLKPMCLTSKYVLTVIIIEITLMILAQTDSASRSRPDLQATIWLSRNQDAHIFVRKMIFAIHLRLLYISHKFTCNYRTLPYHFKNLNLPPSPLHPNSQ